MKFLSLIYKLETGHTISTHGVLVSSEIVDYPRSFISRHEREDKFPIFCKKGFGINSFNKENHLHAEVVISFDKFNDLYNGKLLRKVVENDFHFEYKIACDSRPYFREYQLNKIL